MLICWTAYFNKVLGKSIFNTNKNSSKYPDTLVMPEYASILCFIEFKFIANGDNGRDYWLNSIALAQMTSFNFFVHKKRQIVCRFTCLTI